MWACGGESEPRFHREEARSTSASLRSEEPAAEEPAPAPAVVDIVREPVPVLVDVADGPSAIILSPADLTTGTQESYPTLGIPRRGLSEDEAAEIAGRYGLVTWPEREAVATTVRYVDEAAEHAVYSRIVLQPDRPLENRWYALRGHATADERQPSDVTPLDGEHVVSRFFVGSNPIVRRVVARARLDGGGDIEVAYSERVRFERNPFRVDVNGEVDDTCRIGNPSGLAGADGAMVAWLTCDALVGGAALHIAMTDPVYSLGGGEVRSADGRAADSLVVTVTV